MQMREQVHAVVQSLSSSKRFGARRWKTAFRAMGDSAHLDSQMRLLKTGRPLASFMSNDGVRYEVTRSGVEDTLGASQDQSIEHCISEVLIIHAEM